MKYKYITYLKLYLIHLYEEIKINNLIRESN